MTLPSAPLGRSGLVATRLGFGGAPIGLSGYLGGGDRTSEESRAAARAALVRAVDLGITYFDTAPGYGAGLSETLLGEALAPHRDRITLASKVKFDPGAVEATLDARLRESLVRLRTDRLDLLQIHGSQFDDALAGDVLASAFPRWFARLKREGRVAAVGLTAETPSGALERLVDSGVFDVLQVAYSVVYQGACDYQREPFGIIPHARARGLGIVAMRTATSGVLQKLAARAWPEVPSERITAAAVEFVLATPEVDCALVGMARPEEVEANVALARAAPAYDVKDLHRFYA